MQLPFRRLGTFLFAATLLLLHTPVQSQLAVPHNVIPKKAPHTILTGADQTELYLPLLKGSNIAIFANQTAMVGKTHLVDTLLKAGIHISKIFSPEHGFRGDADAGEHVGSTT